jgi:3',5'-cyclic-AMP phosphodiesterase
VEGLSPGTTYDVVASAEGVPAFLAGRLRTLRPPGGRLLSRFATVSDVHIGEKRFGLVGRIHDDGAGGTYPARALTAAIDEAVAWGAELIVAKGDLTRFTAAAEMRDAGRLLAASPVPIETILGNHDNQSGVDGRAILESQGVAVSWQPRARDLPGLRLVLVNTTHGVPRHHGGQLPADVSRSVAELAAGAATGAWVALHHPPELHWFPTVYPPGIPFADSRVLLSGLAAAHPATFVTCGHRHRNRRYGYGPLVISEVGSTKDYPGVWAGYRVFEDGLIQTVRRISRPDVMAWTETTRRAMNGQWHRWSPGRLEDRCFAVTWPGA